MRSDPLKDITADRPNTPHAGVSWMLRADRKNTTTELLLIEQFSQIRAVIAVALGALSAAVGTLKFRDGSLEDRDVGLWVVVTSVFMVGALASFGLGRLARRLRFAIPRRTASPEDA